MSPIASRSLSQLRAPSLGHSAVATSYSTLSVCSSACVSSRSSLLALPKATTMPGSSTLRIWLKMMPCSSPLSAASAIAALVAGDKSERYDRRGSRRLTE